MERRIKLPANTTPDQLAAQGKGDKAELAKANGTWCHGFYPWNPGQAMTIPMSWQPIPGEYPFEAAP